MRTLVQKVEAYAKNYHMLQREDRVLVGLSGGADSVCLLHILKELGERQGFSVLALHVNHGIRGEEAAEDERFAKELCQTLSIPFFAVEEDVPYYAQKNRVSLEEAGRILRYAALERTAKEQTCTKIALAHHANDSAETMLFHLFRGSRLPGLGGIPAVRGSIIRPLLCCDRKEIEAWLAKRGIPYRTDSTNLTEDYTRNKIRRRMLSLTEEEINPKAALHMQQTAEYIRQVQNYLEEQQEALAAAAVRNKENGKSVLLPALLQAPPFMREALLYEVLAEVAGGKKDIGMQHVQAALSLAEKQSGKCVNLPGGICVRRSYDTLLFEKTAEPDAFSFEPERKVLVPGRYSYGAKGAVLDFSVFPYVKTAEIPKNGYTKWYDYDKIKDSISLRTRKEGDFIRIRGGTKTVKSLFIDEKIPREERSRRLLVACGKEILWIPGIRGSDGYPVGEDTSRILQIRLEENGGHENE